MSLDVGSIEEWEQMVKEVDNDGDGKVINIYNKSLLIIYRFRLMNSKK